MNSLSPGSLWALAIRAGNYGWFNLTVGQNQQITLLDPTTADNARLNVEELEGVTFSGATLTNIFINSPWIVGIVYDANDPVNSYLLAGTGAGTYTITNLGGPNGLLTYHTPLPPSALLLARACWAWDSWAGEENA
jgi:hypothetical protein